MQALRILAVCCGVFLLAGGASAQDAAKSGEKLVGKWEMTQKMGDVEVKFLMEFTKAGKLKMNVSAGGINQELSGTYKVLDDKEMEVEIEFMGEKKKEKVKYKVGDKELEITGKGDKTQKLTRVK